MTAHRDPDRMVHAFLREGQTELADQVYDAVRATIEHRPQRAVIGPWRTPIMNRFVSIGLGAAAVVVVAIIGVQLFGPAAPDGPGAVPTASPSATPSAAVPSPSVAADLPVGSTFVIGDEVPLAVTIPAPGWSMDADDSFLAKLGNARPPDGAFAFGTWVGEPLVPSDPCQWASTMPETPATTIEAVADALAGQATRDGSTPVDVTADDHPGKAVTLHVPADIAFSNGEFFDCDQGNFCTLAFEDGTECWMHNRSPGQATDVWILDVNGEIVIMSGVYFAETPTEVIGELRAMLASMTFSE